MVATGDQPLKNVKSMSPDLSQLLWSRYSTLTAAREAFSTTSCVYVQTDSHANPLRVGKASKGLETRYRGGTGYALDAAMHESGNLVFVAPVAADICDAVERELIWHHRDVLIYNNVGKKTAPAKRLSLIHQGSSPRFVIPD